MPDCCPMRQASVAGLCDHDSCSPKGYCEPRMAGMLSTAGPDNAFEGAGCRWWREGRSADIDGAAIARIAQPIM